MGIEQNSNLIMKIATAHNQVIIAKEQGPGSDAHAIALFTLAHLIVDNPDGLTVAKDLSKPNRK